MHSQSVKAMRKATNSSISSASKKKAKQKYVFKAPKVLVVEVMQPVEYDVKREEAKTGSVHCLGSLDIDFERFVVNAMVNQYLIDSAHQCIPPGTTCHGDSY